MSTDVVHSPFKGMDMPPWWDFHCSIAAVWSDVTHDAIKLPSDTKPNGLGAS